MRKLFILLFISMMLFPVIATAGGYTITRDEDELVGFSSDNSSTGTSATSGLRMINDENNTAKIVLRGSNNNTPLDFGIEFMVDPVTSQVIIHANNIGFDGDVSVTGNISATGNVSGSNINDTDWDAAFGWGDHSVQNYNDLDTNPNTDLDSTDDLVDGDFGSAGLMVTNGAGSYSTTNDNSGEWEQAYAWGDHSSQNYLDLDTYPNADTDTTDDMTTAQVQSEIASHSATGNAHHTKTTSAEIDHDSIAGVSADDHHIPTALSLVLSDVADGTVTSDLVNTAYPWADNEVDDDITASRYYTTDSASISVTQLGDGTVTNEELKNLDGSTAAVLTQLSSAIPGTGIAGTNYIDDTEVIDDITINTTSRMDVANNGSFTGNLSVLTDMDVGGSATVSGKLTIDSYTLPSTGAPQDYVLVMGQDGVTTWTPDCPKALYINSTSNGVSSSSLGNIDMSDATNWNKNKSIIKTVRFYTDSTQYSVWLVQNDNGISAANEMKGDAASPSVKILTDGYQDLSVHVDKMYLDEDSTNEVHLVVINHEANNRTFDIHIDGEERK